jgi:phage terminase large subunit
VINSDKNKESGKTSWFSTLTSILPWSKVTDEESLRKEMKKISSGISDSDFLLGLKGIEDEDLKVPIQEAVSLANTQLSSSVDATVKKLTHAVLRMQQDECKKNLQHEVETEQRKVLDSSLLSFIRDINKKSVGRRPS